jgi:hypothetical protein
MWALIFCSKPRGKTVLFNTPSADPWPKSMRLIQSTRESSGVSRRVAFDKRYPGVERRQPPGPLGFRPVFTPNPVEPVDYCGQFDTRKSFGYFLSGFKNS